MEINPSGYTLAVGNIGEGTVSLVSLDDNKEVHRIAGLHGPHNMTVNRETWPKQISPRIRILL